MNDCVDEDEGAYLCIEPCAPDYDVTSSRPHLTFEIKATVYADFPARICGGYSLIACGPQDAYRDQRRRFDSNDALEIGNRGAGRP
jgi:hypothetical protein